MRFRNMVGWQPTKLREGMLLNQAHMVLSHHVYSSYWSGVGKMNEKQIASQRFVVPNSIGQHRRWAVQLARRALHFGAEIMIRCYDRIVDGKSVLSILALCAQPGTVITVIAKGPDACEALQAIESIFKPASCNETQCVL